MPVWLVTQARSLLIEREAEFLQCIGRGVGRSKSERVPVAGSSDWYARKLSPFSLSEASTPRATGSGTLSVVA